MTYQITHTYLTVDDDGTPVVETETQEAAIADVAFVIGTMLDHPGGRSGSTVAVSVVLTPTFAVKA